MKKILRLGIFLFGFFILFICSLLVLQKGNMPFREAIVDDSSWLVSFIERKLSAPNHQVRMHNVRGVLSSQASIGVITISDDRGVWLEIANAKMNWRRLALMRGRIEIDQLSMERITFLRKPQSFTSTESGVFTIPKLLLDVSINALIAKHVAFKQDFFGLSSDVSLKGHLALISGDLDVDIAVHRLDAPGYLFLLAKISNNSSIAKIDITADEPQNGIVANVLNVEKRPALNLAIQGEGTLDDLSVTLHLKANHQPVLDGSVILARSSEGYSLSTKLAGTIGLFIPAQYRSQFESEVALQAQAMMTKEGVMRLDHMTLQSQLMNFMANAEITADGFLRRLFVNGNMALRDKEKESAHLPLVEKKISADNLTLTIDYGRKGQQTWKGQLVMHHLGNDNVFIRDAVFDMGGVSENLDNPASRHVGIQISGTLQGVTNPNGVLTGDLNQTVHVHLDTDILAGKPALIHDLSVTAQGFSVWLKGELDRLVFKGDLGLKAQTLVPLSLLSGQPLSGSADIKAKGSISLISGVFDFGLSGVADNVKIGVETIDPLLKGKFTLSSNAARNTTGLIILRHLHLKNQHAHVNAKGYLSSKDTKIDLDAQMSDLSVWDSRIGGAVTIRGAARGHNNLIMLSARAHVSEAFLVRKKLQNTTLNINALMDNTLPVSPSFIGFIEGDGTFSEKPLQLSASFNNSNHIWKFQHLNVKGGHATITGGFSQTIKGFIKGILHIDADDISTLSALFLQEGSGSVKGDFILDEKNGRQKVDLKANIDHLIFAENEIKKLTIQADILDPFGAIQFEGFVNAEHIQTPLMIINHLNARASGDNGQTVFNVQLMMPDDTSAQLAGRVLTKELPAGVKQTVQIETVDVKHSNLHATLLKPATIIYKDNGVMVNELGLSVNEGEIVLSGDFYDILNLNLTISALPVALVDLWKLDFGAVGTLSGQVMISGSFAKPDITYDIKGQELTLAALQEDQIMPFMLSAKGRFADQTLTMYTDLAGDKLQMQAEGTVSLDKGTIELHVDLQKFSAHLANSLMKGKFLKKMVMDKVSIGETIKDLSEHLTSSFIKEQFWGGIMIGTVDIGGKLKDLSANFDLSIQDLVVMTHKGSAAVSISTRGSYKNSTLHIEHIKANGYKGLDCSVNGYISLNDSGVDLKVKGTMPLILIDPFLARRGAYLMGSATIDTAISGMFSQLQLKGHLTVANGSFFDPQTNFGLKNIAIEGKLKGYDITLERADAHFLGGGSVSASGHIANDLKTDLVLHLKHANYNDGSMIFMTLTGDANITGHFLRGLVIGGDLTVEKGAFIFPDSFQKGKLLDIKHKNLTKPIQKTLERAEVLSNSQNDVVAKETFSVVQLDIHLNAYNKFLVQGRGLDVELGGLVSFKGPLNDVRPFGELQMIRGRFDILSQRIDFDQGQATFSGSFIPVIHLVANHNSGDTRVTVTVSGNVSDLDVYFSSQPVLPQDEVLARLIFNRSLSELSPFQLAQLASAAAELAGAGNTNTSLLSSLRTKIGLDDLDVVIDEKGNTGLRVGRYIHNNIYLGFEAGSDGTTKGTANLDISKNLKARGAIGNDNNSSFGLFYERDY
ncbi:translocation/assembly module TamB domain-containing protein [Bartonella sp. A05]|uniref:translocation/assembly module TamB domain-containing protein n=1 Tax=Bartonella sp. A05 TaxID=2967261 RepID=UPI0022A947FC|nr:translocation/assembly module TamB domain-containing protein [Bartonella sp. A05]MCZ2203477.1 translocation/assembly module TamB domain-containing protein [Bartonella sp. A05]